MPSVNPATSVKHMKWWGWGVEGVGFHHEDKPKFREFVIEAIGVDPDVKAGTTMSIEDLPIPAPIITDELLAEFVDAVGEENVVQADQDRIVHTYGKSVRDLMRLRVADIPRVPDVIVYPADEADVQLIVDRAVAANAVIIPFGGGTNISGSLHAPAEETRTVISLDLGRMNQVVDIDEESGLARIQAGGLGPDIEAQLNASGWTLGHFPDSFTHSTLGGWVATRSSGMQSDKYGDIAEITRGLRVVLPGKVLVLRPLPGTATGPSVREMILGSEGRLGVITEVTAQVHRQPKNRVILGYLFPNWESGLAAMQEISTSDARPSVTRVSDAAETTFSFATRKKSSGVSVSSLVSKGLFVVLEKRGWDLDAACLSFIGYEGNTAANVSREKAIVKSIVGKHGGIVLGKGPGELYDQKKFDTPYIRDFLLDRGAAADVSDTSAPWSQLLPLYTATIAAAKAAYAQLGVTGYVMCHLSHSEHSGACLYFTFAFGHGDDPIGQYEVVKGAIQQTFVDQAGTLSHHHAVGTEHAQWLEQDISAPGVHILDGLFTAIDPGQNFNPGKIVVK